MARRPIKTRNEGKCNKNGKKNGPKETAKNRQIIQKHNIKTRSKRGKTRRRQKKSSKKEEKNSQKKKRQRTVKEGSVKK